MTVRILIGDMRERLREIADGSIDSCACDPPYHLSSIVKRFGAANAAPARAGKTGAYARASRGFMGQTWDGGDVAFDPATWAEVLRVLKPGAHLVAFSGTRTYHRMACAIEDAGFEIRDQLAWCYGSGFPKSHDVAKGIDKIRDDSAEGLAVGRWLKAQRERRGLKQKVVAALWPSASGGLTGCVANWETLGKVPKWDQWLRLKKFIGFGDEMDAEVWRLNGRKGSPGDDYLNAEIVGEHCAAAPGLVGLRFDGDRAIRATTERAAEWEGWGTALKPAWEPICLARKPLISTVAANVLAHGTGAINIDGCRVDGAGNKTFERGAGDRSREQYRTGTTIGGAQPTDLGRWPANIIHDGSEEVLAHFPDDAGTAAPVHRRNADKFRNSYGAFAGNVDEQGSTFHGDTGSAARFFYCAKAATSERGEGNKHPTVKPVDLMRWLVRLVTPKGGTVLDPFAGSGSTLVAADAEQFDAIGVELDPGYAATAERRVRDAGQLFAQVSIEPMGAVA